MTQINFYTQLSDPLGFACRLVEMAYRRGKPLLIWLADERELTAFSNRLWSFDETSFIPHCRLDALEAADTPVWLTTKLPPSVSYPVLLNLSQDFPDEPQRFSRILEVVDKRGAALAAGRERFRTYRLRGYTIEHHDMSDK